MRQYVEIERIEPYICHRCHRRILGTAVRMGVDWGNGRRATASRLYDEYCASLMKRDVPDAY